MEAEAETGPVGLVCTWVLFLVWVSQRSCGDVHLVMQYIERKQNFPGRPVPDGVTGGVDLETGGCQLEGRMVSPHGRDERCPGNRLILPLGKPPGKVR